MFAYKKSNTYCIRMYWEFPPSVGWSPEAGSAPDESRLTICHRQSSVDDRSPRLVISDWSYVASCSLVLDALRFLVNMRPTRPIHDHLVTCGLSVEIRLAARQRHCGDEQNLQPKTQIAFFTK